MKLALLDRTYTPALDSPMTCDGWMQVNHSLDGCLEVRQVHWLYSLVSAQGDRSLCLFEVPYTERVREACREACMPFQQVWPVEVWGNGDIQALPQETALVVAEVSFDPPQTRASFETADPEVASCLQELNIHFLVSLVTPDGKDSVCLFAASAAEDVRSLYRKVNKSFKQIWKAILIQPKAAFLRE